MKSSRVLIAGVVGALAATTLTSGEALAERKMLVLLDASGSMNITRSFDGYTRWEKAQDDAVGRIFFEADNEEAGGLDGVAVYSFRGSEMVKHTDGFVDINCAANVICTLTGDAAPAGSNCVGWDAQTICTPELPGTVGGLTPLAGSMCDAADDLAVEPATSRVLYVASDGEENNTPDDHECSGDFSTTDFPYDENSWQNNVYNHVTGAGVVVDIALYESSTAPSSLSMAADDPPARSDAWLTPSSTAPSLASFFERLATDTGGVFTHVPDNEPTPLLGDMNGDFCVDAVDAKLVLEQFGKTVPPADARFDLSRDGFIGLADYLLVVGVIDGSCGEGFPYQSMEPLTCRHGALEIEGAAIATAGNAIEVQGDCEITIRDSIIVAGESVIDSRGGVQVTIENSFVAGEDALVTARGAAWISAAQTLLRGIVDVRGSWRFDDQGGNDWP